MEWAVAAGALLLAFVNGANDNVKGAATLFGSGALGSRPRWRRDRLELRRVDRLSAHPTAARRAPWLLLAGLLLAALVALDRWGSLVSSFAAWVDAHGAWGSVAFVASYALAVVALVPAAPLTLLGGALFGIRDGMIRVFAGAVIGSTAAFLVARCLARSTVARPIARHPRFAAIDAAVARRGLWIVFLLRLSPVLPFTYLNFALGLTRISLRDYLLASAGMLPGTLLYVYYGHLAGETAALASGAVPARGAGSYAALILGLLATLAVARVVARIAAQALREADSSEPYVEYEECEE